MTASSRRRVTGLRGCWPAAVFLLPLPAIGCAAMAAAAPLLLKVATNLLDTAGNNYSEEYAEDIKTLLLELSQGSQPGTSREQPAGTPAEGQLALHVALLQQCIVDGRESVVPIEDGAVLQDGRGDPAAGDKIKVSFSANQQCWVYVIAIDGTGWVTPVFPSSESSAANPVAAGAVHRIPEGTRWYGLDENRGVEEFYFVASKEQRPDIEKNLARFAERNARGRDVVRRELLGAGAAGNRLRRVERPAVVKRGIVATESGAAATVQTESGDEQTVSLQSVLSEMQGSGLVVTRWFHHR